MFNFFKRKKDFIDPTDPFVVKASLTGGPIDARFDRYTIEQDIGTEKAMASSEEKKYLGITIPSKKVKIFTFLIIILIFGLCGRSAYLQVVKGSYYYALAEGNRIRINAIPSLRGVIYDRAGNLLVKNESSFALGLIPMDLPRDERERIEFIEKLAQEFDFNKDEAIEEIDSFPWNYNQPIIIKTGIEYEEALRVYLSTNEFPGIQVTTDSQREYLMSEEIPSFSHLLGYMGRISEKEFEELKAEDYLRGDKLGKSGLESSHERDLRGWYGKKKIEIDAFGLEKKIISQDERVDGSNLYLAVDADLQNAVEDILIDHLIKNNKTTGSVIMLDPRNGEVLAMVSWPSYDNNLFSGGISQENYSKLIEDPDKPLYNRSVSGEYPSGSTFKLIVAAAALEEGIITPFTTVVSTGGLMWGSWFFPDWKAGGHGVTDVYKAISQSVNTFFYYIGGGFEEFEGLGVNRISEYAQKFGLGELSNIDLTGERTGFLPSPEWKKDAKKERWYIGDTYHYAIGQGDILVTPLQVAMWTMVFANGGTLYLPHIVYQLEDIGTGKLIDIEPRILNEHVVSEENIGVVRAGMRLGVTDGSSKRLSGLPFSVAGKTGTAQWSSAKDPHAWFTGFAPYDDPGVVITVLVEEGGGGDEVAVPIAYDILLWYFNNNKNNNNEVINLD